MFSDNVCGYDLLLSYLQRRSEHANTKDVNNIRYFISIGKTYKEKDESVGSTVGKAKEKKMDKSVRSTIEQKRLKSP